MTEKNGRLFLCLISMFGAAQCHENKVNELKHNLSLVVRKTLHPFISHGGAHCRTPTSRNDLDQCHFMTDHSVFIAYVPLKQHLHSLSIPRQVSMKIFLLLTASDLGLPSVCKLFCDFHGVQ